MKAQRLRFRYRVSEAAVSVSQRELVRAWAGAIKDAGFKLAYSGGKRTTPQIAIAAPLPFGVTSDCELAEAYLSEAAPADVALREVARRMPAGIEPIAVEEVGVSAPSLQSQLRWAEYEVAVEAGLVDERCLRESIGRILTADSLPTEYRREKRVRQYDLRPLVLDLRLEGRRARRFIVAMRLRAEPEMTGRADQVAIALGVTEPRWIHRRRLCLDEVQPALLAYRRAGQPQEY